MEKGDSSALLSSSEEEVPPREIPSALPRIIRPADGFVVERGGGSSKDGGDIDPDLLLRRQITELILEQGIDSEAFEIYLLVEFGDDGDKYTLIFLNEKAEDDVYDAFIYSASFFGLRRKIISGDTMRAACCSSGISKAVSRLFPGIGKHKIYMLRPSERVESQIMLLESSMYRDKFKVGVLNVEKGQVKESEYFMNSRIGDEFREFLETIGDVVDLKGHKGYSGRLDTVSGLSGEKTVYCNYKEKFEVMFHVSSFLPLTYDGPQKLARVQVGRKRHVGNDSIVVVFMEPDTDTPFDPSAIVSRQIHVYIVVKPLKDRKDSYLVESCWKDVMDIKSFPPSFPKIVKKSELRDVIMTKILVAEHLVHQYGLNFQRMRSLVSTILEEMESEIVQEY